MLICTLCPEDDNEIPPGTEFEHIRLNHAEVLEEVERKMSGPDSPLFAGSPATVAHHMIELMNDRIAHLSHELAVSASIAETKEAFHEKQGFRYRAMIDFCDWLVKHVEEGNPLDPQQVAARAKKVRHAWPEKAETKGTTE